ncbi:hypothetical protein [Bifidobacterium tissieri]|uniref:hypothetical protein n=1 Tax=Bifidobacterium tissieri TaxID=1630162 RepID=UPI00123974C8|nr:hypothetical protein [Bifidobacterium tissieri]KAA8832606.1 hypothetical protein EM849_03630 [Bifidobacterium tissieri]
MAEALAWKPLGTLKGPKGDTPTVAAATTATAGVVKRAEDITPLADNASLADVIAKVNELLTKGDAAGFLA